MICDLTLPETPATNVLAPIVRPFGSAYPPQIFTPVALNSNSTQRYLASTQGSCNAVAVSSSFETKGIQLGEVQQQVVALQAVKERVKSLSLDALSDGEQVNVASLSKMIAFFGETNMSARPAIFLLDSGNFKAQWKKGGEIISIEFHGTDRVSYLLFLKGRDGGIDRIAGVSDAHRLKTLLKAIDAKRLFVA